MLKPENESLQVNCNGIFIMNLEFHREKQYKTPPDYTINLDIGQQYSQDNKELELSLTVDLCDSEKTIKTAVTIIGLFNFPNGLGQISPEQFANVNAASIVYPFCREAISSVSVKAGIQPILLPPFDFIGLYTQSQAQLNGAVQLKA